MKKGPQYKSIGRLVLACLFSVGYVLLTYYLILIRDDFTPVVFIYGLGVSFGIQLIILLERRFFKMYPVFIVLMMEGIFWLNLNTIGLYGLEFLNMTRGLFGLVGALLCLIFMQFASTLNIKSWDYLIGISIGFITAMLWRDQDAGLSAAVLWQISMLILFFSIRISTEIEEAERLA